MNFFVHLRKRLLFLIYINDIIRGRELMKKQTKKFTSALLAISLGASILAGCSSGEKEEGGANGKVKLELFWQS